MLELEKITRDIKTFTVLHCSSRCSGFKSHRFSPLSILAVYYNKRPVRGLLGTRLRPLGEGGQYHLYEFMTEAEPPSLSSAVREIVRYAASAMSIRRFSEAVELGGHRFQMGDELMWATGGVHLGGGSPEHLSRI